MAGHYGFVAWKLGISQEAIAAKKAAGLKWCIGCRDWHPVGDFNRNRAKYDGLQQMCQKAFTSRYQRKTWRFAEAEA